MAKKMSFMDKATKRAQTTVCPVCSEPVQFIKLVRAVKGENGGWKMRPVNVGVCKCNSKDIYG